VRFFWWFRAAAGLLLLVLAFPQVSPAIPLSDVVGTDDEFTAGSLVFSDFKAKSVGTSPELDVWDITFDSSGFTVTPTTGFTASSGQIGALLLSYTVASTLPMVSATLDFEAEADGAASAWIAEVFKAKDPDHSHHPDGIFDRLLFVEVGKSGDDTLSDSVEFQEGGFTKLRVRKAVVIDASFLFGCGLFRPCFPNWGQGHGRGHGHHHHAGCGHTDWDGWSQDRAAEISSFGQHYSVIPEPGTAGMLLLGLAGLAALRRSRV
jgi:hypothetical protein